MRYRMPFMSARYVIDALYVHVVVVVYAASCSSHGPCYSETTRCRNIKYSSLTRYPYLFDTSAFRDSWNNNSINILISTDGTKSHHKRQFSCILPLISRSKYKKLETLIRWHTVDSCLAYSGLMKNGVCQLFLKFAYWVTELWIRWPDYYPCWD